MDETHGLLIYERLLSFAEYRKENGNEMQQALYSDAVAYLTANTAETDRMAIYHAMKLAHGMTEIYAAGERELDAKGWREDFANELKEIYAIIALTKPKEFE